MPLLVFGKIHIAQICYSCALFRRADKLIELSVIQITDNFAVLNIYIKVFIPGRIRVICGIFIRRQIVWLLQVSVYFTCNTAIGIVIGQFYGFAGE